MTPILDDLEATLLMQGPGKVVEHLCQTLRERGDYHGLFYAMLLGKRLELGLPPVQAGTSEQIPDQESYEEAIRQAARTAGGLYLEKGDIPSAWPFFRMINEPGPVADAINGSAPEDGELCQQIIDIALYQGVNPRRGFDLLLKRFGICSAITMFGQQSPQEAGDREYCIRRLVRALYDELRERLQAEINRKEQGSGAAGFNPAVRAGQESEGLVSIRDLIAGRDWLFEDDFAHIDTSHLSAVVQFSLHLSPSPTGREGRGEAEELNLAIELCEYGTKLNPRFRYERPPPFDNQYHDELVYLRTLAGLEVEEGIAHYRAKVDGHNLAEEGTLPAEVLVTLLVRLKRYREAIEVFVRHLADADLRPLDCPRLPELCQLAGDYRPLVEVSRQKGDLVNFAAGLLQARAM